MINRIKKEKRKIKCNRYKISIKKYMLYLLKMISISLN